MRVSDEPDLAERIASTIRAIRVEIGWSERELARRVGTSQRAVQRLESGTLKRIDSDLATRSMRVLGIRITVDANPLGRASRIEQRDLVHGWCSAFLVRVLRRRGWEVRAEVEVGRDRFRGWIDLLAFRPADGTLLVIEIKSRVDDLGRTIRTLGWYTRSAREAALNLGWRPRRIVRLLAVLATAEVESILDLQRDLLRVEFPGSSANVRAFVDDPAAPLPASTLVLIDPATRRRSWVLARRSEGRRSASPYGNYRDAAGLLEARRRGVS